MLIIIFTRKKLIQRRSQTSFSRTVGIPALSVTINHQKLILDLTYFSTNVGRIPNDGTVAGDDSVEGHVWVGAYFVRVFITTTTIGSGLGVPEISTAAKEAYKDFVEIYLISVLLSCCRS